MYTLETTLKIDPRRNIQNFNKDYKKNTIIAEIESRAFGLFYKKMIENRYWIQLQQGYFRPHVTIVGGLEFGKIKDKSKIISLRNIKNITIEVFPEQIHKVREYWVIPVKSQQIDKIRETLGLNPNNRLHITVAREYEPDAIPAPYPEKIKHISKLTNGIYNGDDDNL